MALTDLSRPWHHRPRSRVRGGLLLCHGFTGSPQSLRPWAEDHAARGWEVDLPLLPGHGTTWKDLAAVPWEDWYGHVREAAFALSERHGPIAIGGLSMGGALTLALAEDPSLRDRVAAIVVVNPGMTVPSAARAAGPLSRVLPSLPGIASDIAGDGVEEGYPRLPLAAVAQLRRLFARTRTHLDRVRVPLLIGTSPDDHTVAPSDSDLVVAGVRGPVERVTFPRSYHVVPLDLDAPLLFDTSARFLDEHVPAPIQDAI